MSIWKSRHGGSALALVLGILSVIPWGYCGEKLDLLGETAVISLEEIKQQAPSSEEIKKHLEKLVSLRSRMPGTQGHEEAKAYILERLQAFGFTLAQTPRDDDALPPVDLEQAAFALDGPGQKFGLLNPPPAGLCNLKVTLRFPGGALTGGSVRLDGVGSNGQPRSELLAWRPAQEGRVVLVGDQAFQKIDSIQISGLKGTPGAKPQAQAGYDVRFQIGTQRFEGTAPFDPGDGQLSFAEPFPPGQEGRSYPLYGCWPNGAALTSTGPEGVKGPLLYGGSGLPEELDGQPVAGAIVLLDLGEFTRWTQVAALGAAAVVVIEPEVAVRSHLETLSVAAPVEFPRLWIPRQEGLRLKEALLASRERKVFPNATARVQLQWKTSTWENIFLLIPGSGEIRGALESPGHAQEVLDQLAGIPQEGPGVGELVQKLRSSITRPGSLLSHFIADLRRLQGLLQEQGLDPGFNLGDLIANREAYLAQARRDTAILSAYYDSISVVPALAPGAEKGIGCAVLLEQARRYRLLPPARDTLLLFTTGHFQALKGVREFFGAATGQEEVVPAGDLRQLLERNRFAVAFLERLRGLGEEGLPSREALLRLAAEAGREAARADAEAGEFEKLGPASRRVVFSWAWTGAGLFLMLCAMLGYHLLARARGLVMALGMGLGLVTIFHGAVVPLIWEGLRSGSAQAQELGERMDQVLKTWKETASLPQADLERSLRLLRANGLGLTKEYQEAKEAGDQKKMASLVAERRDLTPEYLKVRAEARLHEEVGLLLYSRTMEGGSLQPPADQAPLRATLVATAAGVVERLKRECVWAEGELSRRVHNLPFQALVADRVHENSGRNCLFVSLDLSTGHPGVGFFYEGGFYGTLQSARVYKGPWGRQVRAIGRAIERGLGYAEPGTLIPDTLLEERKRSRDSYLGSPVCVDAEVAAQAQIRGITLLPPFDQRVLWNTPHDDLLAGRPGVGFNWANLEQQTGVLGVFLDRFLAQGSISVESRLKIKYTGFTQLAMSTVCRGGSRNIFPNIPVAGALVLRLPSGSTSSGVRRTMIESTNPLGVTRLSGVRQGGLETFDFYKCDPRNGEITYALNKAKMGLDENRAFGVSISKGIRPQKVELFRCQGLAFLDVIDPGRLYTISNCSLLAGATESRPQEFGTNQIVPEEPHRVVFAEPGSRVKVLFKEGQFGIRLALLGVEARTLRLLMDPATSGSVPSELARGGGVLLGSRKVVDWLPLRGALDLWCLGESRLEGLRQHSIGNARLDNPAFPGPYSKGTLVVEKGSDVVVGHGSGWDETVKGYQLSIHQRPGTFLVKEWVGPDRLRLEEPYPHASGQGLSFWLVPKGLQPGLHNSAQACIQAALQAREAGALAEAWRRGVEAWGIQARAYPEVLGTANDSVKGVVFYLFLLLPFCFFIERLLFAFPRIEHQILVFFGIFILMFGLLWFVHPAFSIVSAPPIILLAFVIVSLASIVIAIVYGKFNAEMRLIREGIQGAQSADVNRASAAMVAVALGISQMRRRKLRTLLTCVTIVLLTFTALSFTSVVPSLSQAWIEVSKEAPYQGLLLRQLNFSSLHGVTLRQIEDEFAGTQARVAPRYWLVPQYDQANQVYKPSFIDIFPSGKPGESGPSQLKSLSKSTLLGLSPVEREIFRRGDHDPLMRMIVAGSWLPEGRTDVCLLPVRLAEELKLGVAAGAAWKPEQALGQWVRIDSCRMEVVGLFQLDLLEELKDLDNQPLTPLDFEADMVGRGVASHVSESSANVSNLQNLSTKSSVHVAAYDTLIVPWQLAQQLGADLRAVAVRLGGPDDPQAVAQLSFHVDRVLRLFQKSLFVGLGGQSRMYASSESTSLKGMGNLVVPILISVLILLNTMIGAVFERRREIRIFSALGLAPSHISALFLAEAFVYATLGAILGYLLGQGVAKLVQVLDIAGLYLNYSSSSAVFVTAVVMLSVLGSTLYPALMAAREASPSEDRSWHVPDPEGDEITLDLPFSFQRSLVPGAAMFMYEFFESHSEASLGKFTAKEVTLEAFYCEKGQGICLFFMCWLSPYDLGVSQEVQIYLVPVDSELYVAEAAFYRVSGYVTSWHRLNLPFLNVLRKQLLLWRTYSPKQRQEFALRGYYHFQEAFEAIGWPPERGFRQRTIAALEAADGEDDTHGDSLPRIKPVGAT